MNQLGNYFGQSQNSDPFINSQSRIIIMSNGAQNSQTMGFCAGMQDANASTETVYPVGRNNSMNKKLEAAKKWLKERNAAKTTKEA